jgi:hypothetical protein
MTGVSSDDLRAAVAAGLLTEAQAASVTALAQSRAGQRAAMPAEDEPFEFFRGFSEIFVSIGLIILLVGIASLLAVFGGFAILAILPLICAAIAWWWAGYFTLKRRMNLPSMVLATAFGGGIYLSAITVMEQTESPLRLSVVTAFVLAALGMALWYRRFRLPFSAFILGLFALGAVYTTTASIDALGGFARAAGGCRNSSTCGKARNSRWPRWALASRPLRSPCGSTRGIRTVWADMPPLPSGCTCWPHLRW